MQRLFWIGNPFFYPALASYGWTQTVWHNFTGLQIFHWEDLLQIAGFVPDILVVADKSLPPFVLGVENFPCLTVFYSVDSHLHSWYPLYAQAFDLCLVSLKDHLKNFIYPFLQPENVVWSPPYALDKARAPEAEVPKLWDCLFVGTINENTPKRAKFMQALAQRLPNFYCTQGNYQQLFPQARVLLNFCENGDLNFRVFEALGMGGALVTPYVGHGQQLFFQNDRHFCLYDPNSVEEALYRIKSLLAQPEKRTQLAKAGLAAIDAGHRASHRAQSFTANIRHLWPKHENAVRARLHQAQKIRERCLKLPYLLWAQDSSDPKLKQAYLEAATGTYEK